jgi:hypothetical protein
VPLFFAAVFGFAAQRNEKATAGRKRSPAAARCAVALVLAGSLALCPLLSPNQPFHQPEKQQLMQYRFAGTIRRYEGATLLNYGFLDWGFYTAAGVAPHLKYYHLANMPLDELHSEQDRYVREGLSDFVVTRAPLREDLAGQYTLADTCSAPEGLWFTDVYLYRLTALEER